MQLQYLDNHNVWAGMHSGGGKEGERQEEGSGRMILTAQQGTHVWSLTNHIGQISMQSLQRATLYCRLNGGTIAVRKIVKKHVYK